MTEVPTEGRDHTPTEGSPGDSSTSLLPWGRAWRERRARPRSESASILAHLHELRSRLLKISVAVLLGSIVAFVFRNWCFDLLVNPFTEATQDRNLVFFRPTEAFSLFMQISLFGGLVLSSPVILFQLWRFVAPALNRRERRLAIPVTAVLTVLFLGGILLGYLSLERGLGFLVGFGTDRLDPTIGADHYLGFAMRFLMVFGVSFEFPVFLFGLCATGVLSWRTLANGRRWAIVVIVIGGAVATPSGDPLTLTLLAVPLYALYELTILLARFLIKRP